MTASRLTLTLAGAGLAAAACGGGAYSASGTPRTTAPGAAAGSSAAAAGAVALGVHTGGRYGAYLTDGHDRALYVFAPDTAHHSACTGSCATYWPPLLGTSAHAGAASVKPTLVTSISRGGSMQLVYAGHPLYRYVGDANAGDTKGEGLNLSGGKWWLLAPSGAPLMGAAAPASSSGGGNGYGGYGGG